MRVALFILQIVEWLCLASAVSAFLRLRYTKSMVFIDNRIRPLWSIVHDCDLIAGKDYQVQVASNEIVALPLWKLRLSKALFLNWKKHCGPLVQIMLCDEALPDDAVFWVSYHKYQGQLSSKRKKKLKKRLTGWTKPKVMFLWELENNEGIPTDYSVAWTGIKTTDAAQEYEDAIAAQEILEDIHGIQGR